MSRNISDILGINDILDFIASAELTAHELGLEESSLSNRSMESDAGLPLGWSETLPGFLTDDDKLPHAPPDGVPIDSGHLQLVITNHSVHKILHAGTPSEEYVVSNLRYFTIDLQLVDTSNPANPQLAPYQMAFQATMIYENGNDLREWHAHGLSLRGDTTVSLVAGRGQLKLKMGLNALSHKLGKQRVCIKITPVDESLRQRELLTVVTEPLRSVTKLERKRREPRQQMEGQCERPAPVHPWPQDDLIAARTTSATASIQLLRKMKTRLPDWECREEELNLVVELLAAFPVSPTSPKAHQQLHDLVEGMVKRAYHPSRGEGAKRDRATFEREFVDDEPPM